MKIHQTLCHQQIYRQVTKEILEPLTPPGRRSRAPGCCVAILLSWFGFTSPFKGECGSDHLYPMKKHFYPEWGFFSNGKAPIHPYLFKEWCCIFCFLFKQWSRSDRGVHSQGEMTEISGMALSPFMFAMLNDRLTDEVRQEPLWNVMLADDLTFFFFSSDD